MSGHGSATHLPHLENLESRLLLSAAPHGPAKLLAEEVAAPTALTLALDAAAIDENGTVTLTGTLDAPAVDALPVVVTWQDGVQASLEIAAGESTFTAQYQYLDDAADSDDYTIAVTAGDLSAETTITVANVAPTLGELTVTPDSISENELATISGTLTDPGTLDTHSVVIDWGDGSIATLSLAAGELAFSANHTFLNDGTGSIVVTVSDDDGGTTTGSADITVANVAPVVGALTVTPESILENDSATLTGEFTDPGTLDSHTVTIEWGDGSSQTLTLAVGQREFSASHQYLDDSPTGTPSDVYAIDVIVTDDDGGTGTGSAAVTVANVAPAVGALTLTPQSILENDSTTLTGEFADPGTLDSHTVTISWGDGSTETLTLAVGERTFSANHQYLDDDPTGTPSDTYAIGVTVADDDSGTGTGSATLTVDNVAPAVSELTLDPAVIDENGIATLSGQFTDPGTLDTHTVTIDWGDGNVETLSLSVGERAFGLPHQYLDDNPSGTPSDDYTINVTVTDDDTGEGLSASTITVNNVAPVITEIASSAGGVGDASEGDEVSLSGSFTDVGTLDTHTAVIDWGDGTTSDAVIVESGGSGTFSGSHAYAEGGIYAISVVVTDDDTGTDDASASAVISGVGIHDGVLQVIGTDANDTVQLSLTRGSVRVRASFLDDARHTRTLDFSGVELIEVLAGDGNDAITLAGNIPTTLFVDGGAGNDRMKASAGAAVLLGGEGDDFMTGHKGNDLMIGGAGRDRMIGGPGSDLMTGGRTTFDVNDDALSADFADDLLSILAEWNSSRSLSDRMANITAAGSGERQNGEAFLQTGVTVLDAGGDKLTGASGDNWYFDALVTKPGKGSVKSNGKAADKGNGNAGGGQSNGQAGGNARGTVVTQPAPAEEEPTPPTTDPLPPVVDPVLEPVLPGNSGNGQGNGNANPDSPAQTDGQPQGQDQTNGNGNGKGNGQGSDKGNGQGNGNGKKK